MNTSNNCVRLLALCLVGTASVYPSSAAPQYTFSTIDSPAELGALASAFGINNAGVVVGNFVTVDGSLDGFLIQKGLFTDVTVPGAAPDNRGALNDVNDRGEAVGSFADSETGIGHSFVRGRDGTFTLLPDAAPDAVVTEATGINNLGDIVGFYLDASFAAHGFILRSGVVTTYDYPGATRTLLTRINDRDQITGIRRDPDGRRRGFSRTASSQALKCLGPPTRGHMGSTIWAMSSATTTMRRWSRTGSCSKTVCTRRLIFRGHPTLRCSTSTTGG